MSSLDDLTLFLLLDEGGRPAGLESSDAAKCSAASCSVARHRFVSSKEAALLSLMRLSVVDTGDACDGGGDGSDVAADGSSFGVVGSFSCLASFASSDPIVKLSDCFHRR